MSQTTFNAREVSTLAALGSNQGNAAPILSRHVKVTGADGTKGVVLPKPTFSDIPGDRTTVVVNAGSSVLPVYPPTSAAIDGLSVNTAMNLPANSLVIFFAESATLYRSTAVLGGSSSGGSGLPAAVNLSLLHWRNVDGTVQDATGGAGKFAIASTVGTSLGWAGENAKNNTKTDDAIFELNLPSSYVAGQNLTVTVNAQVAGTGTPGTKTLQVKAFLVANAGTEGSNLGSVAQSITTSAADYAFTITGTGLVAGNRLLLEVETVLQETGNVNNINAQINSIRVS